MQCIGSLDEYHKQKQFLPKVFQTLPDPIHLTVDNRIVTAGIRILEADSKLKLEGHVWQPLSNYSDENYIKKFCYTEKTILVLLENGSTYTVFIDNQKFKIQGQDFKASTEDQFDKIQKKIFVARDRRNSVGAGSGAGASQ